MQFLGKPQPCILSVLTYKFDWPNLYESVKELFKLSQCSEAVQMSTVQMKNGKTEKQAILFTHENYFVKKMNFIAPKLPFKI